MMEKVLEKKVVKKVVHRVDPNLVAIEKLTMLNGTLVEQVKALSSDLDDLKIEWPRSQVDWVFK